MNGVDGLPPRRGYMWNGSRWVSIRADRAVKVGALVSIFLVCALVVVLLVTRDLPVLP